MEKGKKPEKMNERQVHLFGTPPSSKDGLGVPKASLNSEGYRKKCQPSFISILKKNKKQCGKHVGNVKNHTNATEKTHYYDASEWGM